MKMLVLMGIALATTIALITLLLIRLPQAEIKTSPVMPVQNTSQPEEKTMPAMEPQTSRLVVVEEFPTPNRTATNATLEACKAMEARLLEDLETARQETNRKQKQYDDVEEAYDDVLKAKDRDETIIQKLKEEKEKSRQELEDAKTDERRITKRLSRTRIECGLYK